MIFWWSESRLQEFIEELVAVFLEDEHFREEIDSLKSEFESLNKSLNENSQKQWGKNEKIKHSKTSLGNRLSDMNERMSEIDKKVELQLKNHNNSLSELEQRVVAIEKTAILQNEEDVEKNKDNYIQYVNKAISDNKKEWQQSLKESVKLLQSEVETSVKRYIQSMNISLQNEPLDKKEIVSELTEYIKDVAVQNNAQINGVLMERERKLKLLSTEIEKQSNTELLNNLMKGYDEEKKKNDELSEIVRKQSEGIAILSKTIEELREQIKKLGEQIDYTDEIVQIHTVKKSLFFDDNYNENKCKLLSLLGQSKELKNQLCEMGLDSTDVYQKLVDNLINKLDNFIAKNSEKQYTADKIANGIVKILKQTIIKGLTQEKVKTIFIQYMDGCGIRRLDWNIGRKISNADYEYLEEPIMYEDVNDDKKAGTILEIIQDTYVVDYLEDDERYEAIIPGLYRIGRNIKK